jgi:hypothetical protein
MIRIGKKPGNWIAYVFLVFLTLCIVAFGLGVIAIGILLPIGALEETMSIAFDGFTDFQQWCVVGGWLLWFVATIILVIGVGKWFGCTDISVSIFAGAASIFLGFILNILLLEERPVFCGAYSLLYLVVIIFIYYLNEREPD